MALVAITHPPNSERASDMRCTGPSLFRATLEIRRRRAQGRLSDMEVRNPHPPCNPNSHCELARKRQSLYLPNLELTVREIEPSLLSPSLNSSCSLRHGPSAFSVFSISFGKRERARESCWIRGPRGASRLSLRIPGCHRIQNALDYLWRRLNMSVQSRSKDANWRFE